MKSLLPARASFSAAGGHSLAVCRDQIWRIDGDGVAITTLAGMGVRRLDGAVVALAAIDREVWAVGEHAVMRHGDDTAASVQLATPIARTASITVCRAGAPAIIVHDDASCRVDDRGVVVLPASREIVVPTPIGEIVRSGRCFVHRTARREVPLPLPGDVVAGSTLCGGAAMAGGAVVALETRGRSGMHLLVVDLE